MPQRFLKWAGGKERLIPQFQAFLPQSFGRYWEPFLGSGSLFFSLQPQQSTLSDCNVELINCWQVVRDDVEALILALEEHAKLHSEAYFYSVRAQHPATPTNQLSLFPEPEHDAVVRAARFKYLNATCFNGLHRTNAKNRFNTSFGNYEKPAICDPERLRAASAALQGVELLVCDFSCAAQAIAGDFVYFDPPYIALSDTSDFTSYTSGGFSITDQIRLRDLAVALVQKGVYVLLSSSDCKLTRSLYQRFQLHEVSAARSINAKADRRGKISELLIQGIPHEH